MNALFAAFEDLLISVELSFLSEWEVLLNPDPAFFNILDLERVTGGHSRAALRPCILHNFRMAVQFSCLPGIVNFCLMEG